MLGPRVHRDSGSETGLMKSKQAHGICDDSYQLIGLRNACPAQDKISQITRDTRKYFHLTPSKTWEMVVVRSRGPSQVAEPPIAGGKRSDTMNILGLAINECLFVSEYVNNILRSWSSSTFALRTSRSRGMPSHALFEVNLANRTYSLHRVV